MPQLPAKDTLRTGMPIAELPGMTKAKAARFGRLNIFRVADLLRHLPTRYERESAESSLEQLELGTIGAARGQISRCHWEPTAFGRKGRFQATLDTNGFELQLVWFNAAYLRDRLHPGLILRVQGKVKRHRNNLQMINPKWDLLDDATDAPQLDERLRPIYPATDRLPSAAIEQVVDQVLGQLLGHLEDPLPAPLLEHHQLPPLADAFRMAHWPRSLEEADMARRRLAFNELLLLQLGIAMKRAFVRDQLVAPALKHSQAIDRHIRARFSFPLTTAQDHVVDQIVGDLRQSRPMNRLLQGDVGSGKTVVALYALLMAVADRKQGVLMAPTELLAEQHFGSITRMLAGSNVRVGLRTAAAETAKSAISSGAVDIIIGTHALLNESIRFKDLAVVVIDEQHRFGVMQRAVLRAGGDDARVPHHLLMTATPIPRTLSLTVFGDLDISTINGLPPGRSPIRSRVVGQDKSQEVYAHLVDRLDRQEQIYVVVPTIEGGLGTISYQWNRDGVAVSGATDATYTLTQADVGTAITVTASYTDTPLNNAGTAESVTSAATAQVANVNDAPTGTVTISGTATEDQVLTASNTLADEDGLGTISYQWNRDGVAVSGATDATYTLTQADVGTAITVTASYTDTPLNNAGTAESVTSAATAQVANVNDAPTGTVTISGTATEDQVLTASNTLADEGGQGDSDRHLKSVREHAALLQRQYFQGFRVETIHGRMNRQTRERIMERFRSGRTNVLVATTVIEVGVDVANATVMVVEHAEQFGLAQLHQLRGRVGRGTHGRASLCVFIAEPNTDDGDRRMKAIASTSDGFEIAELDLQIRGMGDFFGTRQHGAPPLRVARITEDMPLLLLARQDAAALIEQDPQLRRNEHAMLRKVLLQQYGQMLGLIDVG